MVEKESSNDITGKLAEYMAEACDLDLEDNVCIEAKNHIVDSMAAVVSGARLRPGQLAVEYMRALGGTPEAQVIGSALVTSAVNAALANGMMGHADETDDMHMPTKIHPGCGIVPAALAMAEREKASGRQLLGCYSRLRHLLSHSPSYGCHSAASNSPRTPRNRVHLWCCCSSRLSAQA